MSHDAFTGRVDVGGCRLAYCVEGPAGEDAPVVVMLHSLGLDLRMWDEQAAALSRRARVIRYDCRGHGASDLPSEPVSIEQLGGDLLALLDHVGVRRAHLCGLSLGGVIALWTAAHYPERVHRAVFANTGSRIGTEQSWDERIRAVREGGMAAIRDAVLARFLGKEFRLAHPEQARDVARMIDETPPAGYIAICEALRAADLSADIARIRAPSLIIAGECDVSTPPALGEALHAAIDGSALTLLRGAAHLSNVEQSDAFTHAIEAFLVDR